MKLKYINSSQNMNSSVFFLNTVKTINLCKKNKNKN